MDEIPPLTSPETMPPVRTQADLHRLWRALMGPLGFGVRSLWMLLLQEDGRPTKHLVQIDDLPDVPDHRMLDGLTHFLSDLHHELGHPQMVFLLCGPGTAGLSDGDRAWAGCLQDVVRRTGQRAWPVHRANDRQIVVIAPDDLAATA